MLRIVICMCVMHVSVLLPVHPTLFSARWAHKPVLCRSVSAPALQFGSPVPFLRVCFEQLQCGWLGAGEDTNFSLFGIFVDNGLEGTVHG